MNLRPMSLVAGLTLNMPPLYVTSQQYGLLGAAGSRIVHSAYKIGGKSIFCASAEDFGMRTFARIHGRLTMDDLASPSWTVSFDELEAVLTRFIAERVKPAHAAGAPVPAD